MINEDLIKQMNSLCPTRSCKVNEFPTKLKEKLSSYKESLNNIDFVSDSFEKSTVFDIVDKLTVAINEAVDLVYRGKLSAAYGKLNVLVPSLGRFVYAVDVDHSFYRMRTASGAEKSKIGYKDMFHIPFQKRGIVSTQRYSAPGYPCLYLGEHSYGCWEELGRPDLDSCLISLIKNTKTLKLWDLRIPAVENLQYPVFETYSLMLFPLVLACMFKVDDSNVSFKPEYIIPQILLQQIIDSPGIDGIMYTSVHKNKDYSFPDCVFTNYVIPVKEYSIDYRFCPKLCESFKITKPTCEEYLKIQHGSDLAPNSDTIYIDEKWSLSMKNAVYNYNRSLFGNIEKWLSSESDFKLYAIKP